MIIDAPLLLWGADLPLPERVSVPPRAMIFRFMRQLIEVSDFARYWLDYRRTKRRRQGTRAADTICS